MGIYTPPLTALKEKQLKQRVEASLDTKKFCEKIDKIPATNGARVVFFDSELNSVILRDFVPNCQPNPPVIILREKPNSITANEFKGKLQHDQPDSKVVAETVNTGIACGAAVLSWLVIVAGLVVTPVTGGTSLAVSVLGYSAAAASTLQCVNSTIRTANEVIDPAINDHLDSQDWYVGTSLALDAISLLGAGSSVKSIASVSRKIKASSGVTPLKVLKGLSKRERQQLTRDIMKLNNPKIPRKALRMMTKSAHKPNHPLRTVVNAHLVTQLSDAMGASLTVIGSMSSGLIKTLAVGIYQPAGNL